MAWSPSIPGREALSTAAGAVVPALLMRRPIVVELPKAVPRDLGDQLAHARQVVGSGGIPLSRPYLAVLDELTFALTAAPWASAPRRPVAGLGLRRSLRPERVVCDLRPRVA